MSVSNGQVVKSVLKRGENTDEAVSGIPGIDRRVHFSLASCRGGSSPDPDGEARLKTLRAAGLWRILREEETDVSHLQRATLLR